MQNLKKTTDTLAPSLSAEVDRPKKKVCRNIYLHTSFPSVHNIALWCFYSYSQTNSRLFLFLYFFYSFIYECLFLFLCFLDNQGSPFTCGFCKRVFEDVEKLKTHLEFHNIPHPWHCPLCGVPFTSKYVLCATGALTLTIWFL